MVLSVVDGVQRDLAKLPADLRESGLAASALALAAELDGDNSATSKSMCARALADVLKELRGLAPPAAVKADRIDEVNKKREDRRRRRAGA